MNKRRKTTENAKFVTIEDVCQRYSIGSNTARKLVFDNACAIKINKCLRVDVEKLDAAIKTLYAVE